MTKHLVTLHCGNQILATNPGQKFCNRKCAGYFVTRRPGAKKKNRNLPTTDIATPRSIIFAIDSSDPAWNNARRYFTKHGYVLLSIYDKNLKISFQRMEHIVIWEKCHQTRLLSGWVIHHKNESKDDNSPDNLVTLPKTLHKELHVRLDNLKTECTGIEYIKRRHLTSLEYIHRATELSNLRQNWFDK